MDNKKIYEQFNWEKLQTADLKEKTNLVFEFLPADVKTILDVGCGNGVITNELAKKYDVTAVDRSSAALKYVNTKKIQSGADQIPLPDKSFDLVFSSELLEHLEDDVLKNTINEIKRLSKQYVFITVPNAENPNKLAIKCTKCNYVFNRPNHLRSFKSKDIRSLFSDYDVVKTGVFGKKVRYYNNALLSAKKKITPSTAWIPYYWISKEKRNAVCPRCEHSFSYPYKFNMLSSAIDMINVALSPKKPYWLFVVLKQK